MISKKLLKSLGIPTLVMYLLLAVVAIVKMPISTLLSDPLPQNIVKNYEYSIPQGADADQYDLALVTHVSDGDTIEINDQDTIRLLGIDTPELEHKALNIKLECFGKDAETRMKQLVLGKVVYLSKESKNKDKYGRLLRNIFVPLENKKDKMLFVNGYMVGEGFARAYILEKNSVYKEELNDYQTTAKVKNKGLWGSCDRERFRW